MIPDPKTIPDESLRRTIIARFSCDDRTAFANLRVGVLNGIVHLAGVVSCLEIRITAAELAGDVPGVRGVVNRIEAPGGPSPGRRIDLDLKTKEKTWMSKKRKTTSRKRNS